MTRACLAGVNTNLVVALHALLEERNVSRAAKLVGLGQSSMSHALARLRAHFEDPLLAPVGRQLLPTRLAKSLVGPVRVAVTQLETVFSGTMTFVPATSRPLRAVDDHHVARDDGSAPFQTARRLRLDREMCTTPQSHIRLRIGRRVSP